MGLVQALSSVKKISGCINLCFFLCCLSLFFITYCSRLITHKLILLTGRLHFFSLNWTARHGKGTQLLLWWTLFAHFFLCETIVLFAHNYQDVSLFSILCFYLWINVSEQVPVLFQMLDPVGIANWSVTHVDWSEGKWHPRSYRAQDVTYELMRNITVCLVILILYSYSIFCIHLHFHSPLSPFSVSSFLI